MRVCAWQAEDDDTDEEGWAPQRPPRRALKPLPQKKEEVWVYKEDPDAPKRSVISVLAAL